MASTPYEVLGVPNTATPEEIRAAYKRLCMRLHPDRAGGSVELFQAVKAAYQRLQTVKCSECGGLGFTTTRQGIFVTKTPCTTCWKTKGEQVA